MKIHKSMKIDFWVIYVEKSTKTLHIYKKYLYFKYIYEYKKYKIHVFIVINNFQYFLATFFHYLFFTFNNFPHYSLYMYMHMTNKNRMSS